MGIVVIGALFSGAAYHFWQEADRQQIETEFIRRADIRHNLARELVRRSEAGLHVLKVLLEVRDSVSREEFARVAAEIRERYPGIAALEWVPVVSRAERAAYEARLARDLGRPAPFTEIAPDGTLAPARDRPEHYAIFYVEPLAGNERALGLDIQSAATKPFLEKARTSRAVVLSAQIALVQNDRGVVLIWPVYTNAGAPDSRLLGFVQGVFRVAEVLEQVSVRYPTNTMDSLFIDRTATDPRQRYLYYRPFAGPVPRADWPAEADFRRGGLVREGAFEFGGRRWQSAFRATPDWIASQQTLVPLQWLVGGLVITALLATLVHTLLRRSAIIQREVTERTAELNESRRQLSSLLRALPGMAYRCRYGDQLAVIYVSEGALALTGHPAADFAAGNVHFRDLIHPDDTARVRAATRAALNDRTDLEVEFRLRPATGGEKWILSRGRGVYGGDGRHLLFEGLAIDISAQKKAEADRIAIEHKLLEGQKLESLGLMAGGIAHNFNNLLAGILGHTGLARLALPADSPVQAELHTIENTSQRAAELCRQMLAYAGKGRFAIESVNLDALIGEMLPLMEVSLGAGTNLKLNLAQNLPAIRADAAQVRQLVMNLALNASESLGARPGDIVLTTAAGPLASGQLQAMTAGRDVAPGEFVSLEVTDNGNGMTPAVVARMFEPFFTTKFSGRGLGLAAVLGIVRGHAGALDVVSAPGRGSTFRVFFPSAGQSFSPAPAPAAPAAPTPGRAVLIVDDDEAVRNITTEILKTLGFPALAVADGEAAVALFREQHEAFDAVLLDMLMPGLSGEQTLGALRTIRPDIRVLFVSGYAEGEVLARNASPQGKLGFLQKPFSRGALAQKLRDLLA